MADKGVNLLTKNIVDLKEKKVIEKKKSNSMMVIILPVIVVVVILGLIIFNLFLKGLIGAEQDKQRQADLQIASLDEYRVKNGELVTKVQAVQEVVSRDLDPDDFFKRIDDTVIAYKNELVLNYYRRTDDLNFGTGGTATSFLNMARIMNAFEKNTKYIDVNFSGISLDQTTNHINFSLVYKHAQTNSTK